jgi:hypothetical protein
MRRTYRRSRRPRRRSHLMRDLGLFAALMLVAGVLELSEHLGLLLLAVAIGAGAFEAGRRVGRRRGVRRPRVDRTSPADTRPLPAAPAAADQIAALERVCGRPIEAVIASHEHIQRQYRRQS